MLDFLLNNDFLSAIIAFGLVLIPAVIIHELGHFLAAKAVGITILEFGVGYPPRIAKLFSWGETEFTLNWIPLGGFVRPLGEDMIRPLSEEEVDKEKARLVDQLEHSDAYSFQNEREELRQQGYTNIKSVNDVKPWPRIAFMSAGAIANLVTAFVIFAIIGLLGVEESSGTRVYLVDMPQDSMFTAAGLQIGDFLEEINGQRYETPELFFDALAEFSGDTAIVTVSRVTPDNQVENFQVDLNVNFEEVSALANAQPTLVVSSIFENSPAEAASLEIDDVIVALDDKGLSGVGGPFEVLAEINQQNQGNEITISFIRNGQLTQSLITPRINPSPGQGYLGAGVIPQYRADEVGLVYDQGPSIIEYVPLSFAESIQYAVDEMRSILTMIVDFPLRIIRGQTQPEEGRIVSIVGITQIGGEFLQQSIQTEHPFIILRYIALISIALGITNLFPIPPLDGGRILFVFIELVRGKPINQRLEEAILTLGILLLLSLGVLVIINDILNPFTDLFP